MDVQQYTYRLNRFIGELPTTNWIRFVGSILIALTAIAYLALALTETAIDHAAFAEWLLFLAAVEGISYKQFAKKRETDERYVKAKNGGTVT